MYWNNPHFNEVVIGRRITGLSVDSSQRTLRLEFSDGTPVYFDTDADCCSETWWADILGFASCRGAIITNVRELSLPQNPDDDRTRQEYDSVYGYALDTSRGVITIVFRNSSNGYYGGGMGITTNADDLLHDPESWNAITTNDWRA